MPKVSIPNTQYPILICFFDGSSGYKTLSFMDVYSSYNQINMYSLYVSNTNFMSNHGNYYDNIMPFRLKNAGATY